jgi:hypothetical protein
LTSLFGIVYREEMRAFAEPWVPLDFLDRNGQPSCRVFGMPFSVSVTVSMRVNITLKSVNVTAIAAVTASATAPPIAYWNTLRAPSSCDRQAAATAPYPTEQ